MVAHPIVIGSLVVVAVLVGLIVIPAYPPSYDVAVTVTMSEYQAVIASYYSVNGVSASTSGQSRILDINALGFVWGTVTASFSLQVCVGSHCRTVDEEKIFPTLPTNTNLNVQTTITVPYVPGGQQSLSATLFVNGASQGSATGSVCVNC